jgi:hypothetical protein
MKSTSTLCELLILGLLVRGLAPVAADCVSLYATGFEAAEGFDAAYELPGQDGWVGFPYDTNTGAVNASGIISNAITPPGQEAFVGFFPPNPPQSFVSVWRPVNHSPGERPVVTFEVWMTIVDSTATSPNRDNFRWSIYNIEGDRLFSVDFDNHYLDVSYQLDGPFTNVVTDRTFTNDVPMRFGLIMDFEANRWSAAIDGVTFLSDLPITTIKAPLTFGDVDAVWVIFDPDEPGDNYMVFDDYRIRAASSSVRSARLETLGHLGSGFLLRLHGPNECRYAIDVSTDLITWQALKTNVVTGSYYDFIDTDLGSAPVRLYRARWVP